MLLCIVMIGIFPFTSYSEDENYADVSAFEADTDFYYDYLSSETGFTVKKLKEVEAEVGEDLYVYWDIEKPTYMDYQMFQATKGSGDDHEVYSSGGGGNDEATNPMTDEQWIRFKTVVEKADILITKDTMFFDVNCGHAGLVYDSDTVIEALGYDGNGNTANSRKIYIEFSWRERNTLRAYSVPYVIEMGEEETVAEYAADNLVNIPYPEFGFSGVHFSGQITELNCSTLVWYAFQRSIGYQIVEVKEEDQVMPRDILESSNTEMYYSYGWGHIKPHVW